VSTSDLESLLQERAIERVAREIDRAVDDKNWERMRRQFAARVSVDIGAVTGDASVDMTGDDFVHEVAALNVPAKRSYHIHTNALVSIDGDAATITAHSYGWNFCQRFNPPLFEVWGFMHYGLARERGVWLVNRIGMTKLRESGNSEVSAWRGD
jgi:SnoaL-like domain